MLVLCMTYEKREVVRKEQLPDHRLELREPKKKREKTLILNFNAVPYIPSKQIKNYLRFVHCFILDYAFARSDYCFILVCLLIPVPYRLVPDLIEPLGSSCDNTNSLRQNRFFTFACV